MQSSLEGYPHPITGMSPQLKILQQSQKVRQHPTTTQVDPLPSDEALMKKKVMTNSLTIP